MTKKQRPTIPGVRSLEDAVAEHARLTAEGLLCTEEELRLLTAFPPLARSLNRWLRVRRGKIVEVPPEWIGKTVHPQAIRNRDSKLTPKERRYEPRMTGGKQHKGSRSYSARSSVVTKPLVSCTLFLRMN